MGEGKGGWDRRIAPGAAVKIGAPLFLPEDGDRDSPEFCAAGLLP